MNEPTETRNEQAGLTGRPIYSFSREAIQSVDREAIGRYGIPGLVLMENAARSAVEEILCLTAEHVDEESPRPVLILCGKGNNGGDGLALARLLHNEGFKIEIALAFDPHEANTTEEVRTHLGVCRSMNLPIHQVDAGDPVASLDDCVQRLGVAASRGVMIIDSLLGTGLTKPPRPPFDRIIRWINDRREQSGSLVVAIDVPSGLDCDTGRPLGDDAVRANLTITFVGLKKGFLEPHAQAFVGDLAIGDIGAPVELAEKFGHIVTTDEVFDQ